MQIVPAECLRFEECWPEIFRLMGKYPGLRHDLENAVNTKNAKHSVQRVLQWLQAFDAKYLRLNAGFLTVESHDEAIRNTAETLANKSEKAILADVGELKRIGYSGAYCQRKARGLVYTICEGMEITPPPLDESSTKEQIAAAVMRLSDPKWWRRKLRTLQARKLEKASRYLGAVCKKRGGYCSDITLRRRTHQKHRNRNLLEKLEAINDEGQCYTLAELSDLGVSNPVNRRNELMTRIRGFEEYAQDFPGYIPVFITQTCPSRFHSHGRGGNEYSNWNHTTPREAQEYLNSVWGKVRSLWKEHDIQCFGMRVVEPHHDGCPHWHLLLWFDQSQVDQALNIYRDYALADSPDEPGAQERRFTVKRDELAKGATGYIAKYISKNIDGLTENGEAWSLDVVKAAARIDAWASTWGIRQFQQIGGPSVTVWRESRRLSEQQLKEQTPVNTSTDNPEITQVIKTIVQSADTGDWKAFVIAMGGALCPRTERPLRAFMVKKIDEAGAIIKNGYGEVMEQMKGLLAYGEVQITTRLFDWTIRLRRSDDEEDSQTLRPLDLDLCQ